MFCHHCGARLPDGANFCTHCGTRVIVPEAPVEPAAPVEPVAPIEPIAPVEPIVPIEPIVPVEPIVPIEPIAPMEPAAPVEPIAPMEPVAPVEPVAPMEPESFVEPEPVEPAPAADVYGSAPTTVLSPEMLPPSDSAPQWANAADPAPQWAYDTDVATAVHTPAAPPYRDDRAPNAKAGSAGRIVLSVFLSILLCVSLLASILVTVLKLSVTPDHLANVVVDLVKHPGLNGVEDVDDLADYLYDLAKNETGWEETSRRMIRETLESTSTERLLRQMAAGVAKDYISALLEGKRSDGKDLSEKLTESVLDYEDEIEDVARDAGFTGRFKLSERKLEGAIRQSLPQEIGSLTTEKLVEDNEELFSALRLAFSPLAFIGLWVFTALLLALLIVVNRHRFSAVLYCVGIPALILGLIFLAGFCTMELYPAMKELPLSLIPACVGKIVLLTGAGLTGCGVLLIVIKLIVRSVQRKRA